MARSRAFNNGLVDAELSVDSATPLKHNMVDMNSTRMHIYPIQ